MNNTQTLILLFVIFYLVPLLLMFVHSVWRKIYFSLVFAVLLWLGYDTYVALQAETDCRASCAFAISLMTLTIITVAAGSLLAMLSAWSFKKCRALLRNASRLPTSEDAQGR